MPPRLEVIELEPGFAGEAAGVSVGQNFALTKDVVTFGRHEGNDIPLFAFDKVRRHGRLVQDGDDYWIEDISNARYPILVNGMPIRKRAILQDGDVIGVFKVKFIYQKSSGRKENNASLREEGRGTSL